MFSFALTREQVRAVDRRAVEEYGMSGLVLMENAGRGVAETMLAIGIDGPVVVCCGKGNNGGDGFVIARHLDNRGKPVRVLLFADPAELRGDAAVNWRIATKADITHEVFGKNVTVDQLRPHLADADWIVDALLGTGATGEPQPPYNTAISAINSAVKKVMAVDLPSGFDCDTGASAQATVVADHTCTFVAVKPGFLVPGAERFTGRVHVIDIGAPQSLIKEVAGKRDSTSFSDAS
jgi:NAD(P)H-hydrate epimerase